MLSFKSLRLRSSFDDFNRLKREEFLISVHRQIARDSHPIDFSFHIIFLFSHSCALSCSFKFCLTSQKTEKKPYSKNEKTKQNGVLVQVRYSSFDKLEENEDFALRLLLFLVNPSSTSTEPTNEKNKTDQLNFL